MLPGTYDPGFYVPQYLCSRFLGPTIPSPSPTYFISQCLYAVSYFYFCCLALVDWSLYSTALIMLPVLYVPQEGLPMFHLPCSCSHFCCFVLSLICRFVVSYFLYIVVSQFRYFTLQLFHTLWFRPFRNGPLFAILIFHSAMFPELCVPQYLWFPIPMFPDTLISLSYLPRSLCSPVSMFPDPYVPGPMFTDT